MILFVGDKPSPKMKPGAKPFEGAACERRFYEWLKIMNITNSYEDNYHIMNSIDPALDHYIAFHYDCDPNFVLIALGNVAAKQLKMLNYSDYFKLPHPSGRNRQINDKSYIEARLAECKKYIESFAKV